MQARPRAASSPGPGPDPRCAAAAGRLPPQVLHAAGEEFGELLQEVCQELRDEADVYALVRRALLLLLRLPGPWRRCCAAGAVGLRCGWVLRCCCLALLPGACSTR